MASAVQLAQVESQVSVLATQIDQLGSQLHIDEQTMGSLGWELDALWILFGSVLVFFMQVGIWPWKHLTVLTLTGESQWGVCQGYV